jgi:hypothetical protein
MAKSKRKPTMKPKKTKAVARKPRRSPPEVRSDKLSANFIAGSMAQCQEDLADLLAEFRYLKRYSELDDLAYILFKLDTLRTRCDRFAESGRWDDRGDD